MSGWELVAYVLGAVLVVGGSLALGYSLGAQAKAADRQADRDAGYLDGRLDERRRREERDAAFDTALAAVFEVEAETFQRWAAEATYQFTTDGERIQ